MGALQFLLRLLFVLHGLVCLDEGQALSTIGQVFSIHAGHINGRVQYEIGYDLEEHAVGIQRLQNPKRPNET